jgi:hypothetical protein
MCECLLEVELIQCPVKRLPNSSYYFVALFERMFQTSAVACIFS